DRRPIAATGADDRVLAAEAGEAGGRHGHRFRTKGGATGQATIAMVDRELAGSLESVRDRFGAAGSGRDVRRIAHLLERDGGGRFTPRRRPRRNGARNRELHG